MIKKTQPKYNAPAVKKAFEILKLVSESKKEIGITELAKKTGFGKSTIHGLTHALMDAGALEQRPVDKKFFLGPALVDLAFKSSNYLWIKEKAQIFLDRLCDNIGETVFLGILSHSRGIIMATAEPAKPLKISSPPGTIIPLMAGAVGKIFLAKLGKKDALKFIRKHGLKKFTENSITDEKEYIKELEKVKKQGYALDNEEYIPGVKAIAVDIGNKKGLSLALWVVGFSSSINSGKSEFIINSICAAAKELEAAFNGAENDTRQY